jgi:hypothetical protein
VDRPVRVLGVDPGLTRCGIGVVAGPAGRPALVAAVCARTDPGAPIEERLRTIHTTVSVRRDRAVRLRSIRVVVLMGSGSATARDFDASRR